MRDAIFKLRILRIFLWDAFDGWRGAVRDLDARMCCDGYECGCMGSTNREFWEHAVKHEKRATAK